MTKTLLLASPAPQEAPKNALRTNAGSAATQAASPPVTTPCTIGAQLTLLSNRQGLMTKRLALAADRSLTKTAACALFDGEAQRLEIDTLSELADVIVDLKPNQALCYGITPQEKATLVTQEKLPTSPGAVARDREHFAFPGGPGVLMLDYDPVGAPLAPPDVIQALKQALPEAATVELMWRPSASSCIHDTVRETTVRGIAGIRIWVMVSNAAKIPELGKLLTERLWALGLADVVLSKSGAHLERPLFDSAVWQPERIDFVAGAVCDPPLEQRLPKPEIVPGAISIFDTSVLPVLTTHEIATAKQKRVAAHRRQAPEAARVQAAWILERAAQLVAKRGITHDHASEILGRVLRDNALGPEFVLCSSEHGEVTVTDVLADKQRFHTTRFADPLEPDYRDDDRVAYANLEATPPYLYSHAHGGRQYVLGEPVGLPGTAPEAIIDELNAEYGVVAIGKNAYIAVTAKDARTNIERVELRAPDAFRLLMSNRPHPEGTRGNLATYWLSHPQRKGYLGIEFQPKHTQPGYLNLFRGFPIQPKPGQTRLFWGFVREVICNGNPLVYEYVRKWLAHLLQKPEELPGTALVLRGPQGTGKNTFADTIGHLMGVHYVTLNSMEQVTGRFTGHLMHALLVFANEAIWGGTKSQVGQLKAMITDKVLTVEQKGVDQFPINNFRRMIVASNELWAAPADKDDRRFVFLDVPDTHANDHAYFAALHAELNKGGYAALMHDLQAENLTGFIPQHRPYTGFGFDIKLESADSITKWLHDTLAEGEVATFMINGHRSLPWDKNLDKADAYLGYTTYCRRCSIRHPLDKSAFHKAFRKAILSVKESRPSKSKSQDTRQRQYLLPPLGQARREFEQYMNATGQIEWPTLEDEE